MRLNWGHAITAVYTCFAVGTMSFVVFAVHHPADLVSTDYYAKSLEHDRHAEAVARGSALGDRVSAQVNERGELVLVLPGTEGANEIQGRATLYRASNASEDRTWSLALDRDGRQILPTAGLSSGRWLLQLEWRSGGVAFYAERPVTLP